jgi:hypothetical protein
MTTTAIARWPLFSSAVQLNNPRLEVFALVTLLSGIDFSGIVFVVAILWHQDKTVVASVEVR